MREVTHTSALTPRMRRLAAVFGLSLRSAEMARWSKSQMDKCPGGDALGEVIEQMRSGDVVFVTGASGAGKSTLLRGLGRELVRRRWRVIDGTMGARSGGRTRRVESIVDRLARDSGRGDAGALDALAGAGLAEATLLVRCEHELSEGERARFSIARAMAACGRGGRAGGKRCTCMIVDEFTSTLDATTAMSVATSVARWARSRDVACVLVSAREDVVEGLVPDVLVYVGLGGVQSTKRQITKHK